MAQNDNNLARPDLPTPDARRHASVMEIRDRSFGGEIPRTWHSTRAAAAFFDNLPIFFPAGERFFIAIVNYFRKCGDPTTIREFTQQEANHAREHLRYNARLRLEGYPVDAMEARVEN